MNDQPTAAPMTAKKRVTIFSPWAKKMVSVKPYSSSAKKLYRYYIQEFGYDPSWIVPPDLKFHVDTGRFRDRHQRRSGAVLFHLYQIGQRRGPPQRQP